MTNPHENASTNDIRRFEWGGKWEILTRRADAADPRGQLMLHAELYRQGAYICRIVQAPHSDDPWIAANALQTQAIEFIEDWEAREHSGDTGFHDL